MHVAYLRAPGKFRGANVVSDKVHWEPWVYEGRWRQSDTERIRNTESAWFRTSLGRIRIWRTPTSTAGLRRFLPLATSHTDTPGCESLLLNMFLSLFSLSFTRQLLSVLELLSTLSVTT